MKSSTYLIYVPLSFKGEGDVNAERFDIGGKGDECVV